MAGVGRPLRSGASVGEEEIVEAALALVREQGFAALSMRSVAARLGISPFPLYSRIGNREALLDAIASRVVGDASPVRIAGEPWPAYAQRWAHSLRRSLGSAPQLGSVLSSRREVYVDAVQPLIGAVREAGVAPEVAVRTARLLLWSTVGFVIVEGGALRAGDGRRARTRRAGSDPHGVTSDDADALFAQHLGYVIAGLAADLSR